MFLHPVCASSAESQGETNGGQLMRTKQMKPDNMELHLMKLMKARETYGKHKPTKGKQEQSIKNNKVKESQRISKATPKTIKETGEHQHQSTVCMSIISCIITCTCVNPTCKHFERDPGSNLYILYGLVMLFPLLFT